VKKFVLLFLVSSFLYADEIKIAIASNVSYAIKPLITEFNKQHKTKVKIILGSSGKLTAQIKYGAPYDLFLSANMKYPNFLYQDKIALKKPRVYAKGKLALFSIKEKNLINISSINSAKTIALANPKTAPYGKAALEAITNADLLKQNKKKFVYAENISQTLQYAFVAADIAFVAKSSLYSPKMERFKKDTNYIDIDENLYEPILQGIALLNEKKSTLDFYNFMLSNDAKKILKQYGYGIE